MLTKKTFVLFSFIIFWYSFFAQDLKLTYHLSSPKGKTVKNFTFFYGNEAFTSGKIGEPQTLFYPFKIGIPAGYQAQSVKIEFDVPVKIFLKHKILPFQGFKPNFSSLDSNFKISRKVYEKSKIDLRKYSYKVQIFRNLPVITGNFSPIEYFPQENLIKFYTKITIHIKLKKIPTNKTTLWKSQLYKKIIDNPQILNSYQFTEPTLDFLIITSENLRKYSDTLLTFYQKKGYKGKILTTEQIQKAYEGHDLQEKIRNAIKNYYQNNGITYVLLAGDVSIIPYRGLYCKVKSSQIYSSNDIPADIYYGALDGNWNSDNDNKWGEPGESDLLQDVAIGRLPYETSTEAKNMIDKVLNYQKTDSTTDQNKYLLIGEHLWDNPQTYGAQYLNLLIGYHTDSGYISQGIPPTSLIDSLYDRQTTWDTTQLLSKLRQGQNFIFHCGHSNSSNLMRLNESEINELTFKELDGIKHLNPILYTHGCYAGAFDKNDCITEKFLKLPNFTSAVIANSRYGWFNEGEADGPSEHLNREFVHAIFGLNQINLGIDQMLAKNLTAPFVDLPDEFEYGATRWVFYDNNLLGDPLQQVWTDSLKPWQITVPQEITPNQTFTITFNDSLTVRTIILQDSIKLFDTGFAKTNKYTIPKNLAIDSGSLIIKLLAANHIDTTITIKLVQPQTPYLKITSSKSNIYIDTANLVPITIKNIGQDTAKQLFIKTLESNIFESKPISLTKLAPSQDTTIYIALKTQAYLPDSLEFFIHSLATFQDSALNIDSIKFAIQSIIHSPILLTTLDSSLSYKFSGLTLPQNIAQITNIGSAKAHLNIQTTNNQIFTELDTTLLPGKTLSLNTNKLDNQAVEQINITENLQLTDTFITKTYQLWITQQIPTITFACSFDSSLLDYPAQPWQIKSIDFNEPNGYVLESPKTDDNDSTIAILDFYNHTSGLFAFQYDVSSQENHDFFKVYIDNNLILKSSGQTKWKYFLQNLEAGKHSVKFVYKKDSSDYFGRDNVLIDNIFLPSKTQFFVYSDKQLAKIYPNPTNGILFITLTGVSSANLKIFDMNGKLVLQKQLEKQSIVDINHLNTGIYIVKITSSAKSFASFIIKN